MKAILHDHPPAQLWILDIDGTLMPSHTVDNVCYWQAVNKYFGGVPEALDLQQFQNVTDGSILGEWVEKTRGRAATEVEIKQTPTCYVGDGIWDYRASRELGWDFVGIAEGQRAHALRHAGARQVYCNFREWMASETLHSVRNHEHDART